MDIHAIRCFQRVFEKESIHQATKDLCLTPQGVSRIITALEGEMQTPLFVRSRKGMEATPEGRYFYEHTQKLTRQLLDLQLGMQALKRKKAGLHIGFSCGVLNILSIHVLKDVMARHPDKSLEWVEDFNEKIVQLIAEDSLSCGFCIGPIRSDAFFQEEIYRTGIEAVIYEGHPFYDRPSITIEDLKGQPLVGLNEHFSLFHSLVRRCADFGFTPQFVVKTMESRLIYHFCQERVGIGIDVNIHAAPPPLRYVPITEGTPWRIFFVCKKEKRGEPLFQEIIAALTSRHHP